MNISDPRFKYTPAVKTDVADTFRRFGFKATTQAERLARQKPKDEQPAPNVTPITTRRKAK